MLGSCVLVVVEEGVSTVDIAGGDAGRVVPSSWVGGADVVRERFSFVGLSFKTIERYLSAAEEDDAGVVGKLVLCWWSWVEDDGTNWIRLRFMPAPKYRWSRSGISYSSSSAGKVVAIGDKGVCVQHGVQSVGHMSFMRSVLVLYLSTCRKLIGKLIALVLKSAISVEVRVPLVAPACVR